MPDFSFVIPGAPKGKGRPRFARVGNFVRAYTPEETASYENLVKLYAQKAGAKLDERPAIVEILASFPIPKSKSEKIKKRMVAGYEKHQGKPDLDNIAKIVCDSLNGVAWRDDSQVFSISIQKQYSDTPQVWVSVSYYEFAYHTEGRILNLDEYEQLQKAQTLGKKKERSRKAGSAGHEEAPKEEI